MTLLTTTTFIIKSASVNTPPRCCCSHSWEWSRRLSNVAQYSQTNFAIDCSVHSDFELNLIDCWFIMIQQIKNLNHGISATLHFTCNSTNFSISVHSLSSDNWVSCKINPSNGGLVGGDEALIALQIQIWWEQMFWFSRGKHEYIEHIFWVWRLFCLLWVYRFGSGVANSW
jgi:hypothetical protein